MVEVRVIDSQHKQDTNYHNDPFPLWGRLVPSLQDHVWKYTIVKFDEQNISQMCFPDEHYDYDAMRENTVFLGAYDGDLCIGLLVLQKAFFKYMYISDLEVKQEYRRQGIGRKLISAALEEAVKRNYRGLYLQAQDNNLSACLFYLQNGFRIGGADTEIYRGTSQEGKMDITFYLDFVTEHNDSYKNIVLDKMVQNSR